MPEFTQEELNSFIARERREGMALIAKLQSQIDVQRGQQQAADEEFAALLEQHGVEPGDDAAERLVDKLEADLTEFRATSQAAFATAQAEHAAAVAPLAAERDDYRSRLSEVEITHAITDAARKGNAFNPDQIVTVLKPHARQLSNGEVIVTDVMPAALQSPAEVVDYMRTDPGYANFFKPNKQ